MVWFWCTGSTCTARACSVVVIIAALVLLASFYPFCVFQSTSVIIHVFRIYVMFNPQFILIIANMFEQFNALCSWWPNTYVCEDTSIMLAIFENIGRLEENVADEDYTFFRSHFPVGLHTSCMGKFSLWRLCTHHSYTFNLSSLRAPFGIQESWGIHRLLNYWYKFLYKMCRVQQYYFCSWHTFFDLCLHLSFRNKSF